MVNNSESKLDNTIKKTLAGYEAPYDASDWDKMESMLGAAPKVSSFKWRTVIGIAGIAALIAGCYVLYTNLNTSAPPENTEVAAPAEKTVKAPPKPLISTPAVVPPSVSAAAVSEEVKKEIAAPDKIISSRPPINKTAAEDQTAVRENKIKTKKDKIKERKTAAETDHTQSIIGMGNEPIFGDMLDSSKGIVTETREKETTKKAAKASKNLPVGWDNFMLKNVNPDSLKKYREKRDSAKAQ